MKKLTMFFIFFIFVTAIIPNQSQAAKLCECCKYFHKPGPQKSKLVDPFRTERESLLIGGENFSSFNKKSQELAGIYEDHLFHQDGDLLAKQINDWAKRNKIDVDFIFGLDDIERLGQEMVESGLYRLPPGAQILNHSNGYIDVGFWIEALKKRKFLITDMHDLYNHIPQFSDPDFYKFLLKYRSAEAQIRRVASIRNNSALDLDDFVEKTMKYLRNNTYENSAFLLRSGTQNTKFVYLGFHSQNFVNAVKSKSISSEVLEKLIMGDLNEYVTYLRSSVLSKVNSSELAKEVNKLSRLLEDNGLLRQSTIQNAKQKINFIFDNIPSNLSTDKQILEYIEMQFANDPELLKIFNYQLRMKIFETGSNIVDLLYKAIR